jgi:hypothetical protein
MKDKLALFTEFKKAVDTENYDETIRLFEELKTRNLLDAESMNAFIECLNDKNGIWKRLWPMADMWLEGATNNP